MRYPKKHFLDPKREKRVQTYITIVTLVTIIPSIWLAYGIVKKSFWEEQARRFVNVEFQFPRTQVLGTEFNYLPERTIEVRLIGETISVEEKTQLERKLLAFGLENTTLQVTQNGSETDLNVLRSDILKDLYERNEALIEDKDQKIELLEREISQDAAIRSLSFEVANEARINHPNLKKFSMGRSIFTDLEKQEVDTLLAAYASFRPKPGIAEVNKFREWLKIRTKADTVALILD